MIDSKLRARLSRHSTLRRLAAGEPLSVHPDYQPTGIAPRIGHALKLLSEDPQASSTVQGLATAIRHNGDHSILPQLADALEEEGHPAFGQFDWKHAPRAIEIDKALETEIGRHRIRQINPDTGRRENRPLSPGWVLADWKEKTRGRVPLRRAVEIVRQRVPDATKADVVHSVLRLVTNHNNIRPAFASVENLRRQAAIPQSLRSYGNMGERIQLEDKLAHDTLVPPSSMHDHYKSINKANMKMLGVPEADPHAYPDTRLQRRRLSRFRDAVRRLALDLETPQQPYGIAKEDQPRSGNSLPSATRTGKLPLPTARRVSPPVAAKASSLPKGKIIPTAKPISSPPKKPTYVRTAYHVTYTDKHGKPGEKVVFATHGEGAVHAAAKIMKHTGVKVRKATEADLNNHPGASTKFAKYQGEAPERMALGNPDHEAFLQKIAQNPEDDHSSLLFADWLEENGHENSAKVIRGQHHLNGYARPITWKSPHYPHVAENPFQLHALVEPNDDPELQHLSHVDLYFGHSVPGSDRQKLHAWTFNMPHKDVPDLLRGLADEGVHGAEDEWNHMEGLNETPERESAYRAPAGGAIVRGIYYKGGKLMPDLQKFARAFGAKRLAESDPGEQKPHKTKTPEFKAWFGDWENNPESSSKVVDESGKPLVAYHGAMRSDRLGTQLLKGRSTSGPMPYFTSDPEIASNYAVSKSDNSLESPSYEEQFVIRPDKRTKPIGMDRAWWHLPPEERQRISQLAPRVGTDDNSDVVLHPEGHTTGTGGYDYHIKEFRGNHLRALVEEWLNSGNLFNDEDKFLDVLKLAGVKTPVEYHNPDAKHPGVLPAYLSIKSPLVTSSVPDHVMDALEATARRAKRKSSSGADPWDKNTREPMEWVRQLREDVAKGENSMVWTSIPDWATKTLQKLGYDGVIDRGGKLGGDDHQVFIPFHPHQVKSSIANKGTYDPKSKKITRSRDYTAAFAPKRLALDEDEEVENDTPDLRPGETTADGAAFEPHEEPDDLGEYISNQFKDEYGEPEEGIYSSTGFLLEDGRGVPMGPGERYEDHRAAIPTAEAMKRWGWPEDVIRHHEEGTRTPALFELMRRSGALRVHASKGQLIIDAASPLTSRQKQAILDHHEMYNPETVILSSDRGHERELHSPADWELKKAMGRIHSELGQEEKPDHDEDEDSDDDDESSDLSRYARAFSPARKALDEDGDWYDDETPLSDDNPPSFTVQTHDGVEVPIHGSREDGDHGHDYTFTGELNGQEVPVASMTVHRKGPTAKFKVQLPREHRKSGIVEAVRHHADQIAHTHGASLGKPGREELEDHEDAPVREAEFVEPSRQDVHPSPRDYSFAFADERYW